MATTNNKAKINSPNGFKTSAVSIKIREAGKPVHRDSTSGKFIDKAKNENSISEADKLTLRAWKKTFENQKKAA